MKLITPLFIFTIILPILTSTVIAKDSQHLTTIVDAEAIKRINPKYPMSAAKGMREGWVKASFVIEKNGSTSNIIILDSFGSKAFEKSSIKALKKWKFSPATENGKPIQQCKNTIQLDFLMRDQDHTGVSRKFLSVYEKASKALKENNVENLSEQLEEMEGLQQWRMAESTHYILLKVEHAKMIKDTTLQLLYLNQLPLNNTRLSGAQKFKVLYQKLMIEIEKNQLSDAYDSLEALEKIEEATPHKEYFTNVQKKIEQHVESNTDIILQANIKSNKFWSHKLVRNDFSITDIKGSLHKLDVRCDNKRDIFTVEKENTWEIPDSWRNCSVFVYGEDNSEFYLVEHPFDT